MRDPDIQRDDRRAWRLGRREGAPATLDVWVLNVPGAHPLWAWWMACVVHLREEPPVPAPVLRYPEAQHELMVLALDPSKPPPDVDAPGPYSYLMPPDLVVQFDGVGDEGAVDVLGDLVEAFVLGSCSPDSDWRSRNEAEVVRLVASRRSSP